MPKKFGKLSLNGYDYLGKETDEKTLWDINIGVILERIATIEYHVETPAVWNGQTNISSVLSFICG